jgi:hypothetical protein
MEITYRLRPEDLTAVADRLPSILPIVRESNRGAIVSIGVLWLFVGAFLWVGTHDLILVVAWVLLGTVACLLAPVGLRGTRRKRLTAYYRQENRRWVFEPETLRSDANGLGTEGVSGSRLIKWAYIHNVSRSEKYLFIAPSENSVFVVSEDGVTAGDFRAFAEEVESHWRAAIASNPQSSM